MISNINDTIPSPPPSDTIPPSDTANTIPNNPLPEITEVDNLIPQQLEAELVIVPNTNAPFMLFLISIAALLLSIVYFACH